MAHKAPMDHYTRTRYVSFHAIERLRERIGDKHSLSSRGDADLGNALDDAVKNGFVKGDVVVRDRDGRPEAVVDVSNYFGFPMRAIVAKNDRDDSPHPEAIVTIMEGALREVSGGTLVEDGLQGRLGSLGDLLSSAAHEKLRRAAGTAPPEALAKASSGRTKEPVPSSSGFSTWSADPEVRLVLVTRPGAPDEVLTPQSAAAVTRELLRLQSEGVDMKGISVWRPVKVSVAVTSQEEGGGAT